MVAKFENVPGVGRDVRVLRTGFKLNGQAPSVSTPPPRLGQDTEAILEELGYGAAERAALKEEQAV